ncbi:hypothetical protein [Trichocoleus sp. FACHB-46]|nr:hypothetical protein [Trichocoleus sp. FACHB-46]
MNADTPQALLYSVYVTQGAVVLYLDKGADYVSGRFVCSQPNYQMACDFALALSAQKGFPLINLVTKHYASQRALLGT